MLLKVHKVPAEGMDVEFVLKPSVLSAALPAKDEVADILTTDVDCHFRLEPMRKDLFLDGDVTTSLRPTCARCNEPFDSPLELHLTMTLSPERPREREAPDSSQEADEGIYFFRHDEVDLGELVREQILLSLPIRYLCRETCEGLCNICGANLNMGPHSCPKQTATKR